MSTHIAVPLPRRPEAGGGAPSRHPLRWRLHRAGILNVWYYYDQRFNLSGGRLILRGTNGSGKSRALEVLFPFVLDADRRRLDATGSGKVRLEELMDAGGDGQGNRFGYVWVELVRDLDPDDEDDAVALASGKRQAHLTVGAAVRYSRSAREVKVWYFITPLRVDEELVLMGADRAPLSKDRLEELVGEDKISDQATVHRDRVGQAVFGLSGPVGRERLAGLLQLLHTLRSPDVGNRIDEGGLPRILSDALPPLADKALAAAGEKLDGLDATRTAQARLENACRHVGEFLDVYTRYAVGVLSRRVAEARAAAREAETRVREADRLSAEHTRLEDLRGVTAERREELDAYSEELSATITGIKESRAYGAARELDERQGRLDALASAADASLTSATAAREAERVAVEAADVVAGDLATASREVDQRLADVRADLDSARLRIPVASRLAVVTEQARSSSEPVRISRLVDPSAVTRPLPVGLHPGSEELAKRCGQVRETAALVSTAARTRRDQAMAHHKDVSELVLREQRVRAEEDRAKDAAAQAVASEEEARDAAGRRDGAALDLAQAWTEWSRAQQTRDTLGPVDWTATAIGPLLADPGALTGDGGEGDGVETERALSALDAVAGTAARAVRERHAARAAALHAEQEAEARRMRLLRHEAEALQADGNLAPPAPSWLSSDQPEGIVLWQAVDFAPSLSEREQAGLEAALLSSGLLTGRLCADSTVRAADGQVLLAPRGPAVLRSARRALVVAAECEVPAERVLAVLDRIALGESSGHPTWIAADGTWGNGPLSGRLNPGASPRYVGAAARAAARAARLEEIGCELAECEEAADGRERALRDLEEARSGLEDQVAGAPRALALAAARRETAAAKALAERVRLHGARLAAEAAQQRRDLAAAQASHREACAALGLPDSGEELLKVHAAAGAVMAGCQDLVRAAAVVVEQLRRYGGAVEKAVGARAVRRQAEHDASVAWLGWSGENAALAALRESLGASPEEILTQLSQAQQAHVETKASLAGVTRELTELAGRSATAEAQARAGAEHARAAGGALERAVQTLLRLAGHPSLARARGVEVSPVRVPVERVEPAEVLRVAGEVEAGLVSVKGPADATTVLRAVSALERALVGVFDIVSSVDEDQVHVVELCDATGRSHINDAASALTQLRDRGRMALTDRERAAFEDFVLGGVAQELADRITQADRLVKAMNSSLASISTSHGIGVRVAWSLSDPHGPDKRITDLVGLDPVVMRQDQADELISLLRAKVEERFVQDPAAGYTTHLRAALDYRAWHTMDVFITGPEPGRERKITRRAKLSQGETRFVSYVALFAAADAYLSGLPDTRHALRVILLDDAFAKVDSPTIGELLDLLVRLDLDFVMTGHSLWGCFPQVPAVDTYEVRRREGSAAVTTHVHWDGHSRHLRAAP
ncbi:TIGR02680 family protein [Streptomyces erythrochromogenes]|uniref:TIGR02680 family protein n=1 Tax=Streptomyces erythrochromogenes TaxID=285574 RepID=UPI0037023C06